MTSAENTRFDKRVDDLEAQLLGLRLTLVRTTVVVYERQAEPDYTTWAEVNAAAQHEPAPVEVRRFADLELLIDPVTRIRKLRHMLSPEGQAEFDDIASRGDVIDIEISCHEKQLGVILSEAPTVAAVGGNRSGKSVAILFWLLRRWILRGGPGRTFGWLSPSCEKRFAQGVYAIAGQKAEGGGFWPDAVMRLPKKGIPTSAKIPVIEMIDGSTIKFVHGAGDGGHLKSENVVDYVLDELGEVDDVSVFSQCKIRVSQTGGSVAAATTLKRGHWTAEEITKRARDEGPDVVYLSEYDLFESPWMTVARILRLFVNHKVITKRQLEDEVLPSADIRAKVLQLAKHNAEALREHFGIETSTSRMMWPEWRDDYIYQSDKRRHSHIYVRRDGESVRLHNITREVMARKWPRQTGEGRSFAVFAGCDFNFRGHAVILELFGEGDDAEEALSKQETWTLLVAEEVYVEGTTLRLAEQLRDQAGQTAIWYDPHGAKGHEARGTALTSDAAMLRRAGHAAAPANGKGQDGKPLRLSQLASSNLLNMLLASERLFVDSTCVGTIDALKNDLAKPDGRRDKQPGKESDERSGYTDSVRYAAWPVFRSIVGLAVSEE